MLTRHVYYMFVWHEERNKLYLFHKKIEYVMFMIIMSYLSLPFFELIVAGCSGFSFLFLFYKSFDCFFIIAYVNNGPFLFS